MERTKEEQTLILESILNERLLIIASIKQMILDGEWFTEKELGYKTALYDEVQNHDLAVMEYKEGLKKLKV